MLTAFGKWLHEGEEGCVRVYVRPYVGRFFLMASGAALFYLLRPEKERRVILAVTVVLLVGFLFDGRRAIILTEDSLLYRPPFGRAHRILLKDIVCMTPATGVIGLFLTPQYVRGIKLETIDGEPYILPADFPDHAEIAQRLTAVISASARS
jgi:hypothetical protein